MRIEMTKKYLQDRLHELVKINENPRKLSLAFALGVFIAFSPTIGFHLLTCLVVGWMFRLNKIVLITASFINNPWTVVPIYGFCIWVGIHLTGRHSSVPPIPWDELTYTNSFAVLKPYFLSYFIGTIVVGIVAGLISYVLFYRVIMRYRRRENAPQAQI